MRRECAGNQRYYLKLKVRNALLRIEYAPRLTDRIAQRPRWRLLGPSEALSSAAGVWQRLSVKIGGKRRDTYASEDVCPRWQR